MIKIKLTVICLKLVIFQIFLHKTCYLKMLKYSNYRYNFIYTCFTKDNLYEFKIWFIVLSLIHKYVILAQLLHLSFIEWFYITKRSVAQHAIFATFISNIIWVSQLPVPRYQKHWTCIEYIMLQSLTSQVLCYETSLITQNWFFFSYSPMLGKIW